MNFSARNEGQSTGIDSKLVVKLKDRETVIGVFRGDPVDYKQHWEGNRSSLCSGEGCPTCQRGVRKSFRCRINFITRDPSTNQYVVKVVEGGWNVYEQLMGLQDRGFKVERTIVAFSRNGTGQSTTYMLQPIPKHEVAPDLEAILSRMPLHDLGKTIAEQMKLSAQGGVYGGQEQNHGMDGWGGAWGQPQQPYAPQNLPAQSFAPASGPLPPQGPPQAFSEDVPF